MQYLGSHELVIHLEKEGTTLAITLLHYSSDIISFYFTQKCSRSRKNQKTKTNRRARVQTFFLVDQIREASWCSSKLNTVPDTVLLSWRTQLWNSPLSIWTTTRSSPPACPVSENVPRLLVIWVTVRPDAVFPRLPSDCPQARGESSTHEALSMLHD